MLKLVVDVDAEDFLVILICCSKMSTVVSLEKVRTGYLVRFNYNREISSELFRITTTLSLPTYNRNIHGNFSIHSRIKDTLWNWTALFHILKKSHRGQMCAYRWGETHT